MGIPGFVGRWMKKRSAKSITRYLPRQSKVADVAHDLNATIHDARADVFKEKNKFGKKNHQSIIQNTLDELSKLPEEELWELIFKATVDRVLFDLKYFRPQDTWIGAVDGPAPHAKAQQQRSRREKSSRNASQIFDRNCITPGTNFMISLDKYIRDFLSKNKELFPPTIIYSSHLEPGEGEHKIVAYYKEDIIKNSYSSKKSGVHVLIGLDADLIMLSLSSPLPNIYLARTAIGYPYDIVDIDLFRKDLGIMGIDVDNFIILVMLIGNDFLPKCPSLETMDTSIDFLIKICDQFKLKLYSDIGINWNDMYKFLFYISFQEEKNLKDIGLKMIDEGTTGGNQFFEYSMDDEGNFDFKSFKDIWYRNEILARTNDAMIIDLFEKFSNIDIAEYKEKILNMSKSYLVTLEWIYLYYKKGTLAVNHDWFYPYFHCPLFIDIVKLFNSGEFEKIQEYTLNSKNITWDFRERPGMRIFNPLQQLVSVIPWNSRKVLPKELLVLYDKDSPIYDMFPRKFETEAVGKLEHEAIAYIPFVDKERIALAVSTISIPYELAKKWKSKGDLVLKNFERIKDQYRRK